MYFCFMAEELIPSGLAALVVAMVPLWIATAEWFVPGMDRPTARGVVGLLTGFAGLGILLWPRLAAVRVARAELLGMAVMVAGSWLWTAGSVLSKRRPVKVDAFVATGYEMLTAGVLLSVLGLARGEAPRLLRVTTAGWAALAYLVLFGSCIAFTAFVWLMRHAPASKVMTYAYVNPVVAVLLGWGAGRLGLLARPEPIDGWVYAGMAVIVSGVALATTAPTRAAPTVAPAVVPGAAK
jgi:drug/metabolite transporter (DMT)-like permease